MCTLFSPRQTSRAGLESVRETTRRRETEKRKDSQRKPLGAASLVRSGLGCGQSQEQLPVGAVPPPGRCPRAETSGRCRSPHHAHNRLPPAAAWNDLPGLRLQLLRSASHPPHHQATGEETGSPRAPSHPRLPPACCCEPGVECYIIEGEIFKGVAHDPSGHNAA